MSKKVSNKNKWVFFVDVLPNEGNDILKECTGAFANLLVYSVEVEEAIRIVIRCLGEIDFHVKKMLLIEYFPHRLEYYKVTKEVQKAADELHRENVFAIGGAFSAYIAPKSKGKQ